MELHDSYNPKDYTKEHVTKSYRGVRYIEVRSFFAGQLTTTHFECNCQLFETEDTAHQFIDNTFFNVPDPFVIAA